jgi:hypothetical protein
MQQIIQFLESCLVERTGVAIDEVNVSTGKPFERNPPAGQLLL